MTALRVPPHPCYDGCKGWDIFNADGVLEIQRCDECWNGVPDAPPDSYYQEHPECLDALPEECENNACAGCPWCDLLDRSTKVDTAIRGGADGEWSFGGTLGSEVHLYVTLGLDILTVNNREERVEARRLMREAGVDELMIWQGGPVAPGKASGKLLTSNPSHSPQDYGSPMHDGGVGFGVGFSDFDGMPSEEDLSNALLAMVDPEAPGDVREDARDEIDGWARKFGRVHVDSFRRSGVLTSEAGFVLRMGDVEYKITVTSRPR